MPSQKRCSTILGHLHVRSHLSHTTRSSESQDLPHADTLYVDLSRYNGSPVAKVRTHMKYWMDKAAWHKPSVLVLDNIDKLMGTELEVRLACRSIDSSHRKLRL